MSGFKQKLLKSTFLLLIAVLMVTGVRVAIGTTHAEDKEFNQRTQLGNMSASRRNIDAGARDKVENQHTTAARNFAARNEQAVGSEKARPKTKRIIIGTVFIFLMTLTIINLISISYNGRICTTCGYTGSMKAITLSKKPSVNSLLIFLVKVVPALLYYYAGRGRFRCPRCNRTSTNVPIRAGSAI